MKKTLLICIIFLMCSPAYATEIVDQSHETDTLRADPVVKTRHVLDEKFNQPEAKPFELLGTSVPPGTRQTLDWVSAQSPGGFSVPAPVLVVNGSQPGPVLCLTAAVHGDELNGIEIARQVLHGLDPQKLKGTVVGVPVVNLDGFWRRDRYIGDRRDLNRYFPGSTDGSYASRVAHSLFHQIIIHCDAVVDLHTGSFFRENLPQIRADLTIGQVATMAKGFGNLTVLQSIGPEGSLRRAATSVGIPAVVLEIGGPLSLEPDRVKAGVKSIETLLSSVKMTSKIKFLPTPQPVFYESSWLRAESGGIMMNQVKLGAKVSKDQILAKVIDPISNNEYEVKAPFDGVILGRAQNQFVSPGFSLIRIGKKRTAEELEKQGEAEKKAVIEKQTEELGVAPPSS